MVTLGIVNATEIVTHERFRKKKLSTGLSDTGSILFYIVLWFST